MRFICLILLPEKEENLSCNIESGNLLHGNYIENGNLSVKIYWTLASLKKKKHNQAYKAAHHKGKRKTQTHWKSDGSLFPQVLTSKLKAMGTLRLIPRMLALMAVQRQRATSRSTSPWSRLQQGISGGVPTTALTVPLRTLAHTPNFRASLGQPLGGVTGAGVDGGGGALWLHPLTREKKRRLSERKRKTGEELLECTIS